MTTIAVDSSVYKSFTESYREPTVGLVIGARTENGKEYYVAHFAETLEDVTSEEEITKGGSEASDSPVSKRTDLHSIKEPSVAFHGQQVRRMLPGGLSILGLFVVEREKSIFVRGASEMKIKGLINSLSQGLATNSWYDAKFECNQEMVVIHYDPTGKTFSARTIEVGSGGGSQGSKTCEVTSKPLKWDKLECEFDTVAAMHVNNQQLGIPIKKNLQSLMKAFQESFSNAKILIGGRFPSTNVIYQEPENGQEAEVENNLSDIEDEYWGGGDDFESNSYDKSTRRSQQKGSGDAANGDDDDDDDDEDGISKGKAAKKQGTTTTRSNSTPSPVHILFDKITGILRSETPDGSTNSRDEFIQHLHLQGKISVVAFMPANSSTDFAEKMLRRDIVRSVASRTEMHCESLIDEEQTDESLQVYHELPRRVYYQLPCSNILVSDYLFPGEVAQDSVFSFKDLLSLPIDNVKDILDQKELPVGDCERAHIKGSVEEILQQAENVSKFTVQGLDNGTKLKLFLIFLLLVSIFAVFVPFIVERNSLSVNSTAKGPSLETSTKTDL